MNKQNKNKYDMKQTLHKKDEKAETELTQAKKEAEDFKNKYLRALADYKNLENRFYQERQRLQEQIKKECVIKFLHFLDGLDQAEVFNKDPGLKMIANNFKSTLSELGVKEIELLGHEYDPHFAEAVEVVNGKHDDMIVEVLQKAYEINGQVIRPGRVKVSKSVKS